MENNESTVLEEQKENEESVEIIDEIEDARNKNYANVPTGEELIKAQKRAKAWKITKLVLVYIFLTIAAVCAILPFYWMIITSLKSDAEYRKTVTTFFPQEGIMWSNYSIVWSHEIANGVSFATNLTTTLIVGVFSTVLSVIMTIITAYAFARLEFKGKNLLFSLLLATMMIPGELFTITNYITVTRFRWTNTYVVMIVPFLVSVFYIYLLRNSFMQIPDSLYKAAKLDGCSDGKYLLKVMIPLAAPQIISITLLKFIGTWNSYIWPRLVNKTDKKYQLLSNWVSSGFTYPGESDAANTLKMAAACLVTLPLLVLFLCFRKYIMRGVSSGGTKG